MQIQDIAEGDFLRSTTRYLTILPGTEKFVAAWIPANTIGQVLKISRHDDSILWAIEIMRNDQRSQQIHKTQLVLICAQNLRDGLFVRSNSRRCNRIQLDWTAVNKDVWAHLHDYPSQAFYDFSQELITRTEIELGIKTGDE